MLDFYRTRAGGAFFEGAVPRIAAALERIAAALEEQNRREAEKALKGGGK